MIISLSHNNLLIPRRLRYLSRFINLDYLQFIIDLHAYYY